VIRVLLVDDHAVVRGGVARILERAGTFVVAGEAAHGPEALRLALTAHADVCVLDLDMPGGGMGLIARLLENDPSLRILVFSQHAERDFAVRCLEAGAHGYLSKDSGFATIEEAIRRVASGRRYLSEAAQEMILDHMAGGLQSDAPHTLLSSRELDVFLRLARGQRVGEIAAELGISVKTVSTHRTHVLTKIAVDGNVELALYAREHGLA
jgi:two-component system, NarL family, invasion response regulator UvrY